MSSVRRWVLRLLAVLALGGVTYGVVRIVSDGAQEAPARSAPLAPSLKRLAAAQGALGDRMDRLRPGRLAPALPRAIRRASRAQSAAVSALRDRQAHKRDTPDQDRLEAALAAEFDYLDALGSVAHSRRSRLLVSVDDRAQAALDAFTRLPGSQGVEDGIHGTQAFLAWARARG